MLREDLFKVFECLTERKKHVLIKRFGLDDGRVRTLEEVGKDFNITRERIRQIEAKALRKLKNPRICYILKPYLNDSEDNFRPVISERVFHDDEY